VVVCYRERTTYRLRGPTGSTSYFISRIFLELQRAFSSTRESARAEKFKISPPTTLRSEAYREEDPLRPSKHAYARMKDWFAANSLPWTFGCVKTRWKEGRLTERVAFRLTNNCAHVLTASNEETCR